MPYEFVAKNGLISRGNVQVTSSLTAQSVTASLFGTASYAHTASWAINLVGGSGTATNAVFASQSIYATQSLYATSSTNATNATNIGIGTISSDAEFFVLFVSKSNGNEPARVDENSLKYNPSTNTLTVETTITTASWAQFATSASSATTASNARSASYSTYAWSASYAGAATPSFTGKTNNYVPVWFNNELSATSSIYNGGDVIGIGTNAVTSPAKLDVYGLIYGDGTTGRIGLGTTTNYGPISTWKEFSDITGDYRGIYNRVERLFSGVGVATAATIASDIFAIGSPADASSGTANISYGVTAGRYSAVFSGSDAGTCSGSIGIEARVYGFGGVSIATASALLTNIFCYTGATIQRSIQLFMRSTNWAAGESPGTVVDKWGGLSRRKW